MHNSRLIENHIWKHRKTKGLKQEELAFLIGHNSAAQLSRYEKGSVLPKLEQIFKLCYCLGLSIESLYPKLTRKWREEVEAKKQELALT